jgi:hypothetical protein
MGIRAGEARRGPVRRSEEVEFMAYPKKHRGRRKQGSRRRRQMRKRRHG